MIKEVGILHNIRDNGMGCGDFIFPPKQIDYKELIDNTFISILNSKNLSIILEKRIEIWKVAGSIYIKILQTWMLCDQGELSGCTCGIESSAALQFLCNWGVLHLLKIN